jgi:hypothetical protein
MDGVGLPRHAADVQSCDWRPPTRRGAAGRAVVTFILFARFRPRIAYWI